MTAFLRAPLVGYGYLVQQLRRLPTAGFVLRHTSSVASGLILGALVAFGVWTGTVAPERVSLTDLVTGNLSQMQDWIIVSGDLSAGTSPNSTYRYTLTDPAVPNAVMNVYSDVELPVGRSTVSGTYTGGRGAVPVGYRWIGTLHADAVLASELGIPWIVPLLLTLAVLVVVAAHVSYPMFFHQRPRSGVPRAMTMPVGIRHGPLTTPSEALAGSLVLEPGAPVRLRISGADTEPLRLDSVHTGVGVGELRRLRSAEPALRVRRATGELILSFASPEERDSAYAELLADREQWLHLPVAGPTRSAQGELL